MIKAHRALDRAGREGIADIWMIGIEADRGDEIEILGDTEIEIHTVKAGVEKHPEITR
ncbi:hypothetical protein GGD45_003682 [Rhizobium tropici]|uniref:Uncharacterized protein n=1 Tax=Rhizobium tropici TaxID=398 RepID=A0ABR6R264_RHITR|nr:hypothetical protein [Rhizobium tropici]